LADDPADMAHQSALQAHCRNVTVYRVHPRRARLQALPYLLTSSPLTIPYFHSAGLKREIEQAVAKQSYDRIFIYCSAMAQYLDPGWRIPIVTDFVDVDSDKWTQYAGFSKWPSSAIYRREGRALQAYEQQICERSSCVIVTTEREADLLRQIAPQAWVHVIPNGVDTEFFRQTDQPPAGPPTVGFIGDMSYFPNEEAVTFFAHQVLPLVRQSAPDARFLIVGRNPTANVRKLEEIGGVEVTGSVPDIRPYLSRMLATVAPFSIAAGIQNKILEAMASGLPVVCTTRAAQGLSTDAAQAVDVADGAPDIAAKLTRLLGDVPLSRHRGMECRRQVVSHYSWQTSLDRLLGLLANPVRHQIPGMATFSL
jgi:sugar transferase (PEP-CTERM/EpsH1 system associated)